MYQDELNGMPRLTIGNVADEFTIKNYNEELQNKGWTGVYNYNGGGDLVDNGGEPIYYCLKSASDGTGGYVLSYYYIEPTEETEDWDAEPGYNAICVYKNAPATASDATYTDEDNQNFKSALTTIPPQLKLADGAVIYQGSRDVIVLSDFGAIDLRKDNLDILKNDGFAIDENLSKTYEIHVLKKTLDDGSSILASLDFYYGNNITLQYLPNVSTHASWPSELDDEIEDKFNITIPEFKVTNVDEYKSYVKNGVTYIYQIIDEGGSLEKDIDALIIDLGLSWDNDNEYYTDWNERYFVSKLSGYTDDDKYIVGIVFGEMERVHDFIYGINEVSTKIEKFLDKNEITTTLPSLDSLDNLAYPYISYRYEEDYDSINISFFDPSTRDPSTNNIVNVILEYLVNTFLNACWYKDSSNYEYDNYFESPDGKIGVGLTTIINVTTLSITVGSGITHEPKFYFDGDEINAYQGEEITLNCKKEMLPYPITYSSNVASVTVDEIGNVKIPDDIAIGTVITITATMADPAGERTTTCTITITPNYSYQSAFDAVANLYNTYYGLTGESAIQVVCDETSEEYDDCGKTTYSYTITATPSNITSVDEAKTLVDAKLIPTGFELLDIQDDWNIQEDGSVLKSLSFYNAVNDLIKIDCYVYDDNGTITIKFQGSYSEEHYNESSEDDGDFNDEEID